MSKKKYATVRYGIVKDGVSVYVPRQMYELYRYLLGTRYRTSSQIHQYLYGLRLDCEKRKVGAVWGAVFRLRQEIAPLGLRIEKKENKGYRITI
jgi:hypothetical protein